MNIDVLNELTVVKRSGQRVNFNNNKIALAIKSAFDSVSLFSHEKDINKVYEDVVKYIIENYTGRKTINVEDIQDIIETKLKENNYLQVYESFNQYRIRRAASRKASESKEKHKFIKAIERIANEHDVTSKNTPNYLLLDFAKTIACEYTKSYVLDNKFERAHEEGTIYIHNLDYFCLGSLSSTHLIFDKTLQEGVFPLNILKLALDAKSEIDGEITISRIDYLLVPYVIKRFKEIFIYELDRYYNIFGYKNYINMKKIEDLIEKENTIDFDIENYRQYIINSQTINIFNNAKNDSLDIINKEFHTLFNELLNHLNDNKKENKKYTISLGTNTSYEGMIISKTLLSEIGKLERLDNVSLNFKVRKNSNYELLEMISNLIIDGKNIFLSFVDNSYNNDSNNEVEYFSDGKRIFENNNSSFKSSIGRMIIGSTSIDMARLGFKYKNKPLKELENELNDILDLVKNELIMVFETIGDKCKDNYQVVFNNNILDDEKLLVGQKIRKVIKNGVLNIELAGLGECVSNLSDDYEKQKDLLVEILKYINNKVKVIMEETKFNFIVSETSKLRPLKELITLDKAIYGIKKDITDKRNYGRIDTFFNFKELEQDLKCMSRCEHLLTGGNLFKFELPKNATIKKVMDTINIMRDYDIGFVKLEVRRKE